MFRKICYGIILWLVPYITAIPLLPLYTTDLTFFKTVMMVEAGVLGAFLAALYFNKVEKDYLSEGILLGVVWLLVNWLLDVAALLPFSHMPIDRYFLEIGLRYLNAPAITIAVGYALSRKSK